MRGVELGEGEVVTAPVVVSNLDPTTTFTQLLDRDALPDQFAQAVDAIDHRAAYFQIHFALNGLPEYAAPYEMLNDPSLGRNVTFGIAEQMQADYEGCRRGLVPASPSFNVQIPSVSEPGLAPEGKHAASTFAFYFPIGASHAEQTRLRDEMAANIVDKITAAAPNFGDIVERQFNYPAYAYERMFGCTRWRLHPRPLQPEFRPVSGPRLAAEPGAGRRAISLWRGMPRRPRGHVHPGLQLRARRPRGSPHLIAG